MTSNTSGKTGNKIIDTAACGAECFLCRTRQHLCCAFLSQHTMYFLAQKVPKTRGVPIPPAPPQTAPAGSCLVGILFLLHKIGQYHFIYCFASYYTISAKRCGSHKRDAFMLYFFAPAHRDGSEPSPGEELPNCKYQKRGGSKLSIHAIFGHVPKIAYRAASGVPRQRGATHERRTLSGESTRGTA